MQVSMFIGDKNAEENIMRDEDKGTAEKADYIFNV